MARTARKWGLTPAALNRLLARLDPDPGIAGEKYEHLRRALLKFFAWHGEIDAEACADDTLDRLARRLEEGLQIEDVVPFAHGVARLVRLERARSAAAHPTVADHAVADRLAVPQTTTDDAPGDCLAVCLAQLPTDDRTLILRYYTGTRREKIDGRGLLAQELDLTPNALRHRAQRVRDRLKACARRCVEAGRGSTRRLDSGHETHDVDSNKEESRRPTTGRRDAEP